MYDTAFDNFRRTALGDDPKLRTWVQSFIPLRSMASIHTVRRRLEEKSDTLKVSHAVRHSRRLAIRAAKLGPKPTLYLDLSW